MEDDRFNSVYLEGLSRRRDDFRAARNRLEAACGEHTLMGELPVLSTEMPKVVPQGYCIRDGEAVYPLAMGVNSVGRMTDNNVVLRDEHVSRRHFAIVVHQDGRCEIHDIASKNGTILNGVKIAGPTRIRPGDQIKICARTLVFDTVEEPSLVESR